MWHSKRMGFAIIEILVTLLIISILAVMLVPNIQVYLKKSKFRDVVIASDNTKSSVNLCILMTNTANGCSDGANSVLPTQTFPSGSNVSTVSVTNGVITGTGSAELNNATFILTPTISSNAVTWTVAASSTCLTYGYCQGGGSAGGGSGGSGGNGGSSPSYTAEQQATINSCSFVWTSGLYCAVSSAGGCSCASSSNNTLAACQSIAVLAGHNADPAGCVLIP